MSGELAFSLGAFLCVVALLRKTCRLLDDRLDEIQAGIADLIALARATSTPTPGVAPIPRRGAIQSRTERCFSFS
jgi:hypothetical protein